MKKITIALLLAATFSCFHLSCHKFPIPKERVCQVKSIRFTHEGQQTELLYNYNNKRLLTSIDGDASLDPRGPVTTTISYNNQDIVTGVTNLYGTFQKFVYENGRVVRIDDLQDDNTYLMAYRFVYDELGRVIERVARDSSVLRWTYLDNTRNFNRIYEYYVLRFDRGPELFSMREYVYDDKKNPWTSWQNMPLNPYFFEMVREGVSLYMPIPENNVTNYKLYFTLRGLPLKSDEYQYTYQYDGDYPAQQDFLHIEFNPFLGGAVDSTLGVNYYTYECVGGKGKSGK